MSRRRWNNGEKRYVPKTRGRVGHSRRFGTSMGKATIARIERSHEKKVRQEGRRAARAHEE